MIALDTDDEMQPLTDSEDEEMRQQATPFEDGSETIRGTAAERAAYAAERGTRKVRAVKQKR